MGTDEDPAVRLEAGMLLNDPSMLGAHGQRVKVQWVGHHDRRKRTYVAGVEERSRNPVTLAYEHHALLRGDIHVGVYGTYPPQEVS